MLKRFLKRRKSYGDILHSIDQSRIDLLEFIEEKESEAEAWEAVARDAVEKHNKCESEIEEAENLHATLCGPSN